MSVKRSRSSFETEAQAIFVAFGSPLPTDTQQDDGTYLPLWKQEVRDERGRKRLHGAFKGGWSAGYFNTVGSKEGWTPSSFISSRSNRHRDAFVSTAPRPEDFMDEEDLKDTMESQQLKTTEVFAGVGSDSIQQTHGDSLSRLSLAEGNTMGFRLLRKMGWKTGQGIGPKVRRGARLGHQAPTSETYLFSPDDVVLVSPTPETGLRGLGSEATAPGQSDLSYRGGPDHLGETAKASFSIRRNLGVPARQQKPPRFATSEGIGVGVLNDTGSDDEDPFELGPKITYNRAMDNPKSSKKKQKKTVDKPVAGDNLMEAAAPSSVAVPGFVRSESNPALDRRFQPPRIPIGWLSAKLTARPKVPFPGTGNNSIETGLVSRNPRIRAAILGEKQLPGKSVFDYISASGRGHMAAVTGRQDLPAAKGEQHEGAVVAAVSPRHGALQIDATEIPNLDKATALAAISRSTGDRGPYSENSGKRERYEAFLKFQAGLTPSLPDGTVGSTSADHMRELWEFARCAAVFRPMHGFIASRFTTPSALPPARADGNGGDDHEVSSVPVAADNPTNLTDSSERAAKLGMHGSLTRSVEVFHPSRLLCKRFKVEVPPSGIRSGSGNDVRNSTGKRGQQTISLPHVSAKVGQRPGDLGSPGGGVHGGEGPVSRPIGSPKQDPAGIPPPACREVLQTIFGSGQDRN